MHSFPTLLALLILGSTLLHSEEDIHPDDGAWISLFDGRSLNGWERRGGKASYAVSKGEIIGTSVPGEGNSFLCTANSYTNFVLQLEFKVDAKLNSGIQIRSACYDRPTSFDWKGRTYKVSAGRVHGLQVEIDPSARAWTAGIYDEAARGWLNDLKSNASARAAYRQAEWNRLRIECRGDHVRTWLNGVPAANLHDDRLLSGFIALQVHAIGKNGTPSQVHFKGLRLMVLK